MPRRTLNEYLRHIEALGSEVAYIHRRGYRTESWSYQRMARTAFQFARELQTRHIGRGDRVILWGSNCAEWVAAFWGCLAGGAVAVPMDRIAAPGFAARVAHQVGARLLVCSHDLPRISAQLPQLPLETLSESVGRHSFQLLEEPGLEDIDTAEILFTSGTTAEPKGVILTHRNILANLEPLETEIAKYLHYARFFYPIRFMNSVPLSHVFGQFMGIFVPQLLQGVVVFQESLNPSEIIETIHRQRISVMAAVPRMLETLRNKIERDMEAERRAEWFRTQLRSAEGQHFLRRWWRFRRIRARFGWKFWAFVCGGAALEAENETFWSRLGYVVVQGYGLTETASAISVNHPMQLAKGSIGRVLPGQEIKVAADGEILIRGQNIASGYWDEKGVHPVASEEGWFHTGDIGELGESGQLYFKGRKKNVIVTSEGMKIHPEDLEAALQRQPEVRDCVVVGIDRAANAEPCAVLILTDDTADPEKIVMRANSILSGYQQMRQWRVWPEKDFPRTSMLKPRIQEIQRRIVTDEREAGMAEARSGYLTGLIERISGRKLGGLSTGTQLTADLNLSSMEWVEVLGALEDHYQIDLNETRVTGAATLGELEQMLRQPEAHRSEYAYPRWAQRWPVTWLRIFFYYLLAWPTTRLLAWPRVFGKHHLRSVRPPVLVVSNHITAADIGFILAAMPFRLRHHLAVSMEGERLQSMRRPPAGRFLLWRGFQRLQYALVVSLFNVFPLPQGSGFRQAFDFAGQSVDRGYSILVFPEGGLTRDGRVAPFQAGIGLLANNLNIPVLPVRLDGLFELKQAKKKMARPGSVRVTIGPPVRFAAGTDPLKIARDLETRVVSLAS